MEALRLPGLRIVNLFDDDMASLRRGWGEDGLLERLVERALGLAIVAGFVAEEGGFGEDAEADFVFAGFAGVGTVTLRMTGLDWKFPNMITFLVRRGRRAVARDRRRQGS